MDRIRVVWKDPACEVVVLDLQLVDVEACFDEAIIAKQS